MTPADIAVVVVGLILAAYLAATEYAKRKEDL